MYRIAAPYTLSAANHWSWLPQRLARIVQARAYSIQRLKKPTYRHPRTSIRSPPPPGQKDGIVLEQSQSLSADVLRFRQETDLISRELPADPKNLQTWIAEFLRLGKNKLLDSHDSAQTARTLHNLHRKHKSSTTFQRSLHGLIENVRRAFALGTIPSAAQVPLHLLSYYKESDHHDQGIEFWKWLSERDDAILDPIFVGPAIELLAVYGADLQHCEDVFERTLLQQENISSQYQLQSGSIVPDRSRAVQISGTSLSLLQGILSARLLSGKWQSSYLTLDTAFRLHPTQIVPRFLDLFVYERPIFEALPVFFMFCRGGNRVSKVTFATMLDNLKKLADHTSSPSTKVGVVRAMFQMVEAYTGSAGVLNSRHLNILTRAVVCAMPRVPATVCTESSGSDEGIVMVVFDLFKRLFAYFAQHNALPDPITFHGTIPKALSLGYPLLAKILFDDMVILDLSPSVPTAESLMTAAGLLQDAELLKIAWRYITRCSERQTPNPHSWRTMTISAKRCGLGSFAEEQLRLFDSEIALSAMQAGNNDCVDSARLGKGKQAQIDANDALNFRNACTEMLELIHRMMRFQPGDFRDFQNHPFNEANLLTWPDNAEESWQRKLYDELTQDKEHENRHPTSPDGADDQKPLAVSNTGVRFDELRYLNWKAINSLLVQAEQSDKRVKTSTGVAAWNGRASPKVKTTKSTSGVRCAISIEQLQTYLHAIRKEKARGLGEDDWRELILRLRKPEHDFQKF
ncbi:MAG: hypothetical protein LQ339_006353 [Xanthoria mediterranea]|nr:MAG: hypothetical protein LQ339_006353 [Xanthoria mediterranea]